MAMSDDPQVRRRWRREALLVTTLAGAGAVCAGVAAGDETLGAIALGLFCVAGILGAVFVFYEIGRSEDREREREVTAPGAPPPSAHPPGDSAGGRAGGRVGPARTRPRRG